MSWLDSAIGNVFRKQIEAAAEKAIREKATQYPAWVLAQSEAQRYDMYSTDAEKQTKLYTKLSWIATAIDMTATTAASNAVLSVKRMSGEDENDIPNHEFEEKLRKPNDLHGEMDLWNSLFSWYKLLGNSYLFLNRANENEPPSELWVIPANKIEPVPDGNQYLRGYIYDTGFDKIPLENYEVMHVKTFNPNNSYVGTSAIESLAVVSYGDLARQNWSTNLYSKDNAKVPGALAFADFIADDEWNKLKEDTRKGWGGQKQSGPLFLRNVGAGGVQWVQMSMSQKDMMLLDERQQTKEEIWSKLAPGLSSILDPNATEANAIAGKSIFIEFNIYPILKAFGQKITQSILPAYGDGLVAEFDDIRQTNRILDLQEQDQYSRTHTVAEIRSEYYQDDPLGDERDELLPAQITANVTPQDTTNTMTATPENMPATPSDAEIEAEMKAWERFAIKRLENGGRRDFVPRLIPLMVAANIKTALKTAPTGIDIRAVFSKHRGVDELTTALAVLDRATKAAEALVK